VFSPTITTPITSFGDDASSNRAVSFGQINNERKNSSLEMSEKPIYNENHNQQPCYEIRIKGHLDDRWAEWFEGMTILLNDDGNTVLTGAVIDQAALHRLLKKVRDLGMPLVSVNRV
jgi:hypothetical protein